LKGLQIYKTKKNNKQKGNSEIRISLRLQQQTNCRGRPRRGRYDMKGGRATEPIYVDFKLPEIKFT